LANPKPLLYKPGEKANYDNINFLVLALVLEKASGEPFHDFILTHILGPAGMSKTRLYPFCEQFDPSAERDKAFATPHLFPHLYSDEPVRADLIPYVSSYWKAYRFAGFGEYASTTHDLLKFDQALADGRLLSEAVLKEAYAPRPLDGGAEHPFQCGLGWMREKDESLGTIVYHGGGAIGLSCVFSRNLTRHQTVVVFDIAHGNVQAVALDVFQIMNGRNVPTPRKSAARFYGRAMVQEGPEAAEKLLNTLAADRDHYELNEDEINSLGYDLMGDTNPYHLPGEHKYPLALRVFQTNVRLFPKSWNVYDSCGELLLKMGRKEEATAMYRKSLEINPRNENGKKTLEKIEKEKKGQ
jgi:tetratricopeptide (TPR) repeat protein